MNNIKNIIVAVATCVSAFVYGASSQSAYAPPGTDNFAIGYGAGYQSSGVNQDVICLGTDAGKASSGNTRCIFIGKNAGTNVNAQTDYIDIGGVFKSNNGDIDIGGVFKTDGTDIDIGGIFVYDQGDISIGPKVKYDSGTSQLVFSNDNRRARFGIVDVGIVGFGFSSNNRYGEDGLYIDKSIWACSSMGSENRLIGTWYLGQQKLSTITIENGDACLYTNGVKAGTLSFTPAQ